MSLQNAEAERESRDLREAVTASQDDDMMEYALNRSVSLAMKTASLATSQDEALKQAMAASIESSLPSVQESSQLEVRGTWGACCVGRVARGVRGAWGAWYVACVVRGVRGTWDAWYVIGVSWWVARRTQSATETQPWSLLPSVEQAALHQSEREMVTPRGARAESNAVRAFEEEFSGTAGRAEGETAAASRSRCNTATAPCGEAGRSRCNTAASATGGEEDGVYEAQTHFVLMQLSR